MNGARKYHSIFHKAGNKKLFIDSLEDVSREFINKYGGYAHKIYKWGIVHFLLDHHARGDTFKIWLIDGSEKIEVYGIVSGQPGWTESYGWTKKGTWVKPILQFIMKLEKEIAKYDEQQAEIGRDIEREKNKEIGAVVNKFNDIFRNVEVTA